MTDTTDTPENYTPAVVVVEPIVEPTVTIEAVPEYDQADGSFH